MRDCQSFEKIYNFLKPVLDILILCNLVAGLCEGVIKEGQEFCIRPIDLEEVFKS